VEPGWLYAQHRRESASDRSIKNSVRFCMSFVIARWVVVAGLFAAVGPAWALEIQLPAETGVFKQGVGAEIANGQCLICHSVEYVTTQPPMPRAFWKGSVQKMQQKYGAPIPDAQVESLVDYLTINYGVAANGPAMVAAPTPGSSQPQVLDGAQLAGKYGCFGCHSPTTRIVGPAYRDIAAKYKTDPDALAKVDQQIHQGGSGKWGPIIMPPFPGISASETKSLAEWILGMK
jgi:cytochrome c551/c552